MARITAIDRAAFDGRSATDDERADRVIGNSTAEASGLPRSHSHNSGAGDAWRKRVPQRVDRGRTGLERPGVPRDDAEAAATMKKGR
jgi:hypothetical protein